MSKRLLLLCGATSLVLVTSSVQASHSWEGYHWARAANPITVTLVDRLDATWDPYLPPVSGDWSQSQVLNTTVAPGASDLLTRTLCLPAPGVVVTCNANYGPNLWLGRATIWTNGDHITQGSVQMNDFYFSQARYNNTSERRHVLCQEVGHTLGLAHQSESGESLNTCMDYYDNTSDADTKSTTPNQHDYDQLSQIYSHLDGAGGGRRSSMTVHHLGDVTVIQFIYWI